MDKYEGINRPEVITYSYEYEVKQRPKQSEKQSARLGFFGFFSRFNNENQTSPDDDNDNFSSISPKDSVTKDSAAKDLNNQQPLQAKPAKRQLLNKTVFTALRYGTCALLLIVPLMGRHAGIQPITAASDRLHAELSRSITDDLSLDLPFLRVLKHGAAQEADADE